MLKKIINLFQGDRLRNKASRGGIWLAGGSIIEQGLRFIRNMILTRILAPEIFGVMAIVLAVIAAAESFTEVGVRYAIIQHPRGADKEYLNGAWLMAMTRGIILYSLAFFCAPLIADFYNNIDLIPLLRVALLTIIFNGAISSKAYVAIKQMRFNKWVFLFHGGGTIGIIITVLLSFYLMNVWALVIGYTCEAAFRLILSYFICPFLPTLKFDRDLLSDLFKFARGMFGLGILFFIFRRVDIFVIGKLWSASILGLYSMAVSLAQLPFEGISSLMDKLGMAAFSEIQHDKERVVKMVIFITSLIVFFTMPLILYLFCYGSDILSLVYGTSYASVAIPFAIIFCIAFLRFSSLPIAQVYFASGHPELHRLFTLIRTILIIILIYPMTKYYGVIGAASAGLISMFIGYTIQIIKMKNLFPLNILEYMLIFVRSGTVSLFVLVVWLFTHQFIVGKPHINLFVGFLGCILSYSVVIYFILKSKNRYRDLFKKLVES